MISSGGFQNLLKEGGRHFSGVDEALLKNIEACKELGKITKTSLGPNGMNKLLINHIGRQFVTSDTAVMIEQLEVMHPAAKLLVMASKAQEQECGDATNLCLAFGAELLVKAEELLKEGIHASDVIRGYELARDKAVEQLPNQICWSVTDMRSVDQLTAAVRTCLASKHFGSERDLAPMIAQACVQSMPPDSKKFNPDNIRVAKVTGGAISKSHVVNGFAFVRDSAGTVKSKENAKVAVFGSGIEIGQGETKGTVLIQSAEQLLNFTSGEEKRMEEFVDSLVEAGVDVVVSGATIQDTALHYLNKANIMVLKEGSKFGLQRICRTLGCPSLSRLGKPMPDELGFATSIRIEECGSTKLCIMQSRDSKVSTIVLRSATMNQLDELDRAIDDAVNCIRCCATKDARFVAGAGAAEIELAHQVQKFGAGVSGLDQYAVLKFAEALEVVPKGIASNAGLNAMDAVTALYAAHQKGQKSAGIDVDGSGDKVVLDAEAKGILDHFESKSWALRLGADAALSVLRVDHIIVAKQAGGPKGGEH